MFHKKIRVNKFKCESSTNLPHWVSIYECEIIFDWKTWAAIFYVGMVYLENKNIFIYINVYINKMYFFN